MRILLFFLLPFALLAKIHLGVDQFFSDCSHLAGKRVGLVINQTSKNKDGIPTLDLFIKDHRFPLKVLFAPEHGITGSAYAFEHISHGSHGDITLFSLHGETRRPSSAILSQVDLIIYDIQSIGSRSYTYETTLFYLMEEAAKMNKEVIVLDRPNPMGGLTVDGPMLDDPYRSYIGYIAVPYCHGMTIGELAKLFNKEYQIGCKLTVVPMKGWKRSMTYAETGLAWIPPSPNIPEPTTPFFYASTGILGELRAVSIGVGYTLPFKVVGAPWLENHSFCRHLNAQNLPGVQFHAMDFKPFFGSFKKEKCSGIYIQITDYKTYRPSTVQFLILGMLKSLYPEKFQSFFKNAKVSLFEKAAGSHKILTLLQKEKYPFWPIFHSIQKDVEGFIPIRSKYLLYN
jgi:uncharacterized protein YbbC (DUF1343 family)